MKNSQDTFKRRIIWFIGGTVVSFGLMLTRLTHLQAIEGETFVNLVDANRFYTIVMPKERGGITDRYGQPLVFNQPLYYKQKKPDQLYSDQVMIDRSEALQLMTQPGNQVTMEMTRTYPLGAAGSQILGYTGPVTADDMAEDSSLRTTDSVGKSGLEKKYNSVLQGTSAKEMYEINALGKKTRLVSKTPGKTGETVATTLDPFLTAVAFKALGEQTGAVVITNAETGGILALTSSPSYDPNVMSAREADPAKEKERKQKVAELFNHPKQLFFDRAVGGAYPPGSVFKLITALAGMETGAIDTSTVVEDQGVLKVGEYSYNNWYYSQYGRVEGGISVERALARSNDIFFYKTAEWIGPDKLAGFANTFGLGKKTGIELSGESAGFVPTTGWKEAQQGEKWYLGNTYHFGIGQGDLLVTPVQVAQFTQAIANHGTICQPTVLQASERQCKGLGFGDDHLQTVVSGMVDACSPGGTAFPFFEWNRTHLVADAKGYPALEQGVVGCKTGTAEFGATMGNGKKKTHGWFTMVVDTKSFIDDQLQNIQTADTDNQSFIDSSEKYLDEATWLQRVKAAGFPDRITITVLVESDEVQPFKEGSADGGPVAKKIVDWMNGKQVF